MNTFVSSNYKSSQQIAEETSGEETSTPEINEGILHEKLIYRVTSIILIIGLILVVIQFGYYLDRRSTSSAKGSAITILQKAVNSIQKDLPVYFDIRNLAIRFKFDEIFKDAMNFGEVGYGFALFKDGTLLYHPSEEYVWNEKTIFQISKSLNDKQLLKIGTQIYSYWQEDLEHSQKQETACERLGADKFTWLLHDSLCGHANKTISFWSHYWKNLLENQNIQTEELQIIEYQNPNTGELSWIMYQHIKERDLSLVAVVSQKIFDNEHKGLWHRKIWLSVNLILLFVLFGFKWTYFHVKGLKGYWWLVVISSFLFLAGIGFLWVEAIKNPLYEEGEHVTILDQSGLEKFLYDQKELIDRSGASELKTIPTGIFINSLEFETANNIAVTGYIWQKFIKGAGDNLNKGVIFPDAIEENNIFTSKPYTQLIDGEDGEELKVYRWHFKTILRETYDYSKYPFDKNNIWVRLWPADFDEQVFLIPDLDSYPFISPYILPGLEEDLILPSWETEKSFFDFKFESYNTNFGINHKKGNASFPELNFNVSIKRKFVGPFVSNVIPLMVVAGLVFGLLMLAQKEYKKKGAIEFDAQTTLSSCAALIFIVILAHIDLRGDFSSGGFFYLEYFYFVMYLMILLVALNATLFTWGVKNFFSRHFKLLYWPVLLGSLWAITLSTFY